MIIIVVVVVIVRPATAAAVAAVLVGIDDGSCRSHGQVNWRALLQRTNTNRYSEKIIKSVCPSIGSESSIGLIEASR